RLAAPEQQAHAVLQLAVADDRVAVEEPDRVTVPDLVLRLRQRLVDLLRQAAADGPIDRRLSLVVPLGLRVHAGPPPRGCRTESSRTLPNSWARSASSSAKSPRPN